MRINKVLYLLFLTFLIPAVPQFAPTAHAFGEGAGCVADGGCGQVCTECHTLTRDEANRLLKTDEYRATIKSIKMSEVKGLWEVVLTQNGKTFPIYIDIGKRFFVEARITPLEELQGAPTLKKVDLSMVPLDGALVMGNPRAEKRVIIFDDPQCGYCRKLHVELDKIVEERDDIAFHIILYPLLNGSYEVSKTIQCAALDGANGLKLLQASFDGKKLKPAECDTDQLDKNLEIGKKIGVNGTPAIVLPDGRLMPGYVPAEVLLGLIDNPPAEEAEEE